MEGLSTQQVIDILGSSIRVVAFNVAFAHAGDFIPRYESNWGAVIVPLDRQCQALIVNGSVQQRVEAIDRIIPLDGRPSEVLEWRTDRDEGTLHRGKRGAWRLLDHPGKLARRGNRVGEGVPRVG